MAQEERAQPAITSLPRVEDIPVAPQGYDQQRVQDAFEAFRRHVVQLQAQLRVLQAAGAGAQVDPTGHAVRMDALHLIREAAEFADVLERDAQRASAAQLSRTEQEVRRKQTDLQKREGEIDSFRQESERQRAEIVNAARNEARQLLADANRQATQELREAEARGARLLEQSRHQATELTNSARAEVEQTLEWARAQADVIVQRARMGAEQLLSAAGHGDPAVQEAVDAIVRAAEATVVSQRGPQRPEASAMRQPPAAAPDTSPAQSGPSAPEAEEEAAPAFDETPVNETDGGDAAEAGPADGDERPGPS
jgi:F0F1-type ATP synthase membrane subunit b/b'